MKSVLFYLGLTVMVFSVTFVSCKKKVNDNSCNVSNPTEDLVWLKEVIEASENDKYAYIKQATYKRNTVFYWGSCDPAASWALIVKDCNGDQIGDIENEDLKDEFVLWQHQNSLCSF